MTAPRLLILATVAAALSVPAPASAAPGELTQLAGTDRCISETGTSGLCADGTGLALPTSVAVSPDGRHAYATAGGGLTVFDRNGSTGALTQKPGTAGCISDTGSGGACVDGNALQSLVDVAVSPDGEHVYVAAYDSGAVSTFDRDPATGLLTQTGCVQTPAQGSCASGTALEGAQALAVSPDGKSVYAVTYAGAAVALDRNASTGALIQHAGPSGCVSDTGSGGACVDGVALAGAADVVVSPDGKNVYVAADSGFAVAVLDRSADGSLTQKPGTDGCISDSGTDGACVDGRALVFSRKVSMSADGRTVYVASHVPGAVAVFDRAESGVLTQKPGIQGCASSTGHSGQCAVVAGMNNAQSVTVSPDGASVYATGVAGGGVVVVFDRSTTTGVIEQKAGSAGCVNDSGESPCADGVALQDASDVALSPDSASVYVVSGDSSAIAVFGRERPAAAGGTPPPPSGGGSSPGTAPPAFKPPPPPTGSTPSDPKRVIILRTRSNPDGTVVTTISVSGPGTVTVTASASSVSVRPSRARAAASSVRIARVVRKVTRAGQVKLTLRPNRAARKVLRRKGKLRAALRTTFKPVAGSPSVSKRSVVFRLRR